MKVEAEKEKDDEEKKLFSEEVLEEDFELGKELDDLPL